MIHMIVNPESSRSRQQAMGQTQVPNHTDKNSHLIHCSTGITHEQGPSKNSHLHVNPLPVEHHISRSPQIIQSSPVHNGGPSDKGKQKVMDEEGHTAVRSFLTIPGIGAGQVSPLFSQDLSYGLHIAGPIMTTIPVPLPSALGDPSIDLSPMPKENFSSDIPNIAHVSSFSPFVTRSQMLMDMQTFPHLGFPPPMTQAANHDENVDRESSSPHNHLPDAALPAHKLFGIVEGNLPISKRGRPRGSKTKRMITKSNLPDKSIGEGRDVQRAWQVGWRRT